MGGTSQLIELGGKTVEGLMLVQNYNQDASPRYRAFQEAYRKRFGKAPAFGSVLDLRCGHRRADRPGSGSGGIKMKDADPLRPLRGAAAGRSASMPTGRQPGRLFHDGEGRTIRPGVMDSAPANGICAWLILLLCVSSVVQFRLVIGALLFLVRVPQISSETRAGLQVGAAS